MDAASPPSEGGAAPGPGDESSAIRCCRILKQATRARAALHLLHAAAAGESGSVDLDLTDRWQPCIAAIACALDQAFEDTLYVRFELGQIDASQIIQARGFIGQMDDALCAYATGLAKPPERADIGLVAEMAAEQVSAFLGTERRRLQHVADCRTDALPRSRGTQ
jgi:hypothetical protein